MKTGNSSHYRKLKIYGFGISGVLIGLGGFIFGSRDGLSLFIYALVLIGGIQYLYYGYKKEKNEGIKDNGSSTRLFKSQNLIRVWMKVWIDWERQQIAHIFRD